MNFHKFGISFLAIFVSLDIIGTLPIFISMSRGLSRTEKRKIVNTSMWVALAVALTFVVAGDSFFNFFGFTLYDFKIAGGLVLLLVSLADLVGGPESVNQSSGSTGIVPLAVPLISGPAVIATLIIQVNSVGYLIAGLALMSNYFLAWILLRNSETVTRLIGRDGTIVLSKIAALLLTALAVSMVRSGIFDAIEAVMQLKQS